MGRIKINDDWFFEVFGDDYIIEELEDARNLIDEKITEMKNDS